SSPDGPGCPTRFLRRQAPQKPFDGFRDKRVGDAFMSHYPSYSLWPPLRNQRIPSTWMKHGSKPWQADAPAGTTVSGGPPAGSAPWALSTGTCSLQPSAQASPPP